MTTYLGALRAQLVAVPVNPRAKVEELAWMIADSGARLVVADSRGRRRGTGGRRPGPRGARRLPRRARRRGGRARPRAPAGRRGLRPAVRPTSSPSTRCAPRSPGPCSARPDPETLACLLYTGSTVDLPRAAMLTHRALLANIEQTAAVRPADGRPRRRGARGAAALPRLRPERRPRQRPAPGRDAGAHRPLRPARHPRRGRRARRHGRARGAGGVPALARAGRPRDRDGRRTAASRPAPRRWRGP